MALKILTTGLDQYAAGGSGKVKVLNIGGPGAGKTRWASYFPKPIFADCEAGLSSVADRGVQFSPIKNSQDMLELLVYLRQISTMPEQEKPFQTVVIDTLDAFQRKVKDEWLQAHPGEQSFRGFDAWGFLDAKMQMLLTRLLNLDLNVIVNVHYTDKSVTEGEGTQAITRQEIQLQLSGAIKDQIFNDFDLVGWMGTYFEQVDGQRVQKRGITFKPTYEKPFLKDRLHVTPNWMEVTFSDNDYAQLFNAVISRMDDIPPSTEFGEVPSLPTSDGAPGSIEFGGLPGGPVPPQDPATIPLESYDKTNLQKIARDEGVEFKGNTLKSELVAAIQAKRAAGSEAGSASAPAESAPAAPVAESAPIQEAPVAETSASSAPSASAEPAPAAHEEPAAPVQVPTEAPGQMVPEAPALAPLTMDEDLANRDETPAALQATPAPQATEQVPEVGTVDMGTGEILSPEQVAGVVGGQVISSEPTPEAAREIPSAPPAPVAAPPVAAPAVAGKPTVCEEDGCDTPLHDQNPDYVQLSYIKWRKSLCDTHYLARKKAS